MGQLLVRGLQPETLEELKRHAKANHRSLEAEARLILEDASCRLSERQAAMQFASEMRRRLQGRYFQDSTQLIREDRDMR